MISRRVIAVFEGGGLDGEYTVILTGEDDRGAEGSATVVIEVLNPSPLARFTFRPVEPVVFDASASYDPAALGPKEVMSWRLGVSPLELDQ